MYRNNRDSSFSGPPPPHPRRSLGHERYDAYPPPPPANLPPPPPPAPRWDRRDDHHDGGRSRNQFHGPFSDLRQSRHDSRHDSRRGSQQDFQPPRGEFTFRQEAPSGISSYRPPATPRYDSRPGNQHHVAHQFNHNNSRGERAGGSSWPRRDDSRRPRGGHNFNQPRRHGPFSFAERTKAAHRPLLSKKFDEEGELMLGNTAIRATYRDIDELSDSDEVDMDISDNGDSESDENTQERPAKRTRLSEEKGTPSMPKWSNPDPYTALPPPESTRKKDVVQLIRKARVQAEAKQAPALNEPAEFISFDFSEDEAPSQARNGTLSNGSATSANATSEQGQDIVQAPPKPQKLSSGSGDPELKSELAAKNMLPNKPANPHSSATSIDLTTSPTLGTRKRTIDDLIKLPHEPMKRVNRMASAGSIIPDWRPIPAEDPCPWVDTDHTTTPNGGTRLHKEICDFYDYVRPRDFEEKVRQDLIDKFEAIVKKKWYDAKILPFGSFKSGLYLPTADMDIAVCSRGFTEGRPAFYDQKKHLYHMRRHFEFHKLAYQNRIEVIARAKVPLLKYRDAHTGLKVDISFEKMDGYNAIDTFLKWKEQYPAMPPLVAIIKHYLLMRGLNEPVNGGIGGFSVICMVVHLLQMSPQLQTGSMKGQDHLGDLFMEFLDYYGNRFEYKGVAIRLNPPGLVNKATESTVVYRNMNRLSIIDPNNAANDISGGSSNFGVIRNSFSDAYYDIHEAMTRAAARNQATPADKVKDTLLYPLFAGNYSQFRRQRDWLEKLAKDIRPRPQQEQPGSSYRTR